MTIRIFAAAAILAMLSACTDPNTYPGSGEECTPGDPVQGVDATYCPPASTGGF
ncbi:hypothetical protein ACRDNQ_10760 [Palleronia sp. KMU-117]|uniref:hypothetical protein n=1 Tax=Palleronia sp. KMU-117 TaxID=3434108 RepID=UPI003D75D2DE